MPLEPAALLGAQVGQAHGGLQGVERGGEIEEEATPGDRQELLARLDLALHRS